MKGIGHMMPITMICFFIGAMSVIGLPPTGGFITKWYMVLGAVKGGNEWFMAVYFISSFLNVAYLLPIVYSAFFIPKEQEMFPRKFSEAPRWALVPPVIAASCSVMWFFLHDTLFELVSMLPGLS